MKEKRNQGITLVALVVTIIIMIILAGVSIKLLSDNGLIGNAESAKKSYEWSEDYEFLQQADATLRLKGALRDDEFYKDADLQEELEKMGKENITKDKKNGIYTVRFKKTGNYFEINVETGEIIREVTEGENKTQIANLEIKAEPTSWTTKNVTVTISADTTYYDKIYYTTNGKDPEPGTGIEIKDGGNFEVANNCTIRARAYKGTEAGEEKTCKIGNIDKINPSVEFSLNGGNSFIPDKGKATIKTKVTVKDEGGSGVKEDSLEYGWSQKGEPTEWKSFENGKEIRKTDIEVAGEWYLWIRYNDNARHNAGEEAITNCSQAFIIGDPNITIGNPTWNGAKATMTITGSQPGAKLQYKIGSGAWTDIASGSNVTVDSNTVLYACLLDGEGNRKTVSKTPLRPGTVSYNANGGTGNVPANQGSEHTRIVTVNFGTLPTRAGYTFAGWNTQTDGNGTNYTSGGTKTFKMGTTDVTLYAKWTANSYTVTYNANEGTGNMPVDTVAYDTNYTTKSNTFTRTGCTFVGWKEENGTDWTSWIGRPWKWTYTKNVTLYAQWQINNYTVTINRNNNNYGTVSNSSISVPYGTTWSVSGNTLTFSNGTKVTATVTNATGYTTSFSSWSLTSGTVSGNTTITANFTRTANNYTLYYNANGGSVNPGSLTARYGTSITMPTPRRDGYTFNGWYTATSGGTRRTYTTMPAGNETVYAQWTEKAFTIYYNANGGSGAPSATNVAGGTTSDISSITPTRSGYKFMGWAKTSSWNTQRWIYSGATTAPDGSKATQTASSSPTTWRSTFGMTGDSITLYAMWSDITVPNVSVTASPTGWTNGSVCLTGKSNDRQNGIMYYAWTTSSSEPSSWEKLTDSIMLSGSKYVSGSKVAVEIAATKNVTTNGTYYFWTKDVDGNKNWASMTVTNIDKTVPSIGSFTAGASSTIATQATLSASVSDSSSGISKIVWYYRESSVNAYSSKTTNFQTVTMNGKPQGSTSQTGSISLTGLKPSTTYYVYADVYDVAGNRGNTMQKTVTTGTAVAEYNSTKYTSIQNAVNAVSSSGTVKLLQSTTEDPTISAGKTITLNLNNKTITGKVENNGTLTINGSGKIYNDRKLCIEK